MSKPDGYLFRGAAFSSKKSAFEILVHSREQELRFHETWEKEAKPYFFNDNQPQLSIPKKIAEMLDYCYESEEGYADVGYIVSNVDMLPAPDYMTYYDWLQETDDNKNYNIALAYLLSKALGVELVSIEG